MPKKQPVAQLPKVKFLQFGSDDAQKPSVAGALDSPQSSLALSTSRRAPHSSRISAENPSLRSDASGWQVQSVEDIIKDARQSVQVRHLQRIELDDAALERRRQSAQEQDQSFLIILPDNRVRSIEDHISSRVRALLLEEDEPEAAPVAPKAAKTAASRKARAPWYLPPKTWFSGKVGIDPNEKASGGFPYDSVILGISPSTQEQELSTDAPRRLTMRDKESLQIVEAYRHYMKGSRLPHFLQ